jgi:ketosteroid isomerase-like protein
MQRMADDDETAVAETNRAFYAAFEARDLDGMAELWERSERATVTHPGWPTLRGWPKVAGSWDAIFSATPYIQFFITDEYVHVVGDVAWVTVNENILQSAGSDEALGTGTVAAVNVFARHDGAWRIVVHHGSPVLGVETVTGEEH